MNGKKKGFDLSHEGTCTILRCADLEEIHDCLLYPCIQVSQTLKESPNKQRNNNNNQRFKEKKDLKKKFKIQSLLNNYLFFCQGIALQL